MKKIIALFSVAFIVLATVFLVTGCQNHRNCCKKGCTCCKDEMSCKKDCCKHCDGKDCDNGKCCTMSDSTSGHVSGKMDCCKKGSTDSTGKALYVCPMCKDVTSDKPGKCPHCGMEMERKH